MGYSLSIDVKWEGYSCCQKVCIGWLETIMVASVDPGLSKTDALEHLFAIFVDQEILCGFYNRIARRQLVFNLLVMIPEWIAAAHTYESDVYTSAPHNLRVCDRHPIGQFTMNWEVLSESALFTQTAVKKEWWMQTMFSLVLVIKTIRHYRFQISKCRADVQTDQHNRSWWLGGVPRCASFCYAKLPVWVNYQRLINRWTMKQKQSKFSKTKFDLESSFIIAFTLYCWTCELKRRFPWTVRFAGYSKPGCSRIRW